MRRSMLIEAGLYHFNHRDLVFEGLLYHLIILLFAIIQWQLIAFVNKKKSTYDNLTVQV